MSTTKTFGVANFTWVAGDGVAGPAEVAWRQPSGLPQFLQSAEVATQFVEIEREDRSEIAGKTRETAARRSGSASRKSATESRSGVTRSKKRDREQERIDRLEELYDDGREALDDEKYEQAREKFSELAKANGPQTDAALYWSAYAEQRLGQRQAALAAIADLKKRFPQSRWQKDASALEIEVRQGSGQPARPKIKAMKS